MSLFAARINSLNALNNFRRGSDVVNRNIDKSYDTDYHSIKDNFKKDTSFGYLIPTEIIRAKNSILSEKLLESITLREQFKVEVEISNELRNTLLNSSGELKVLEVYDKLVADLDNISNSNLEDESHIIINEDIKNFLNTIIDIDRVANETLDDVAVRLDKAIDEVNNLINEVAKLNNSIASTQKNTLSYASLEESIESTIKDIASYMGVRVFRDQDTGVYNIYGRNGKLFIANAQVGLQLDKVTDITKVRNFSPEVRNFRIINTLNNVDITSDISEGRIKALESTGKEQLDSAINYAHNFSIGLVDFLMLPDNSSSQGVPDRQRLLDIRYLRDRLNTGNFNLKTIKQVSQDILDRASIANGVRRPFVPIGEIFDNTPLTQFYIPPQLTFNQQPFFLSSRLFSSLYSEAKKALESSVGERIATIPLVTSNIVREYQGQNYTNLGLDIAFNKDRPTDPTPSTARSNVEQLFRVMDNLLNQEVGIPDNLIHVHNLRAYTQSTGAVIQPPPPRALPSFDNELTLASVKTMITNIEGYLNNYPNDPNQALLNHYNNWHEYQKHEFHYLLNEINSIIATDFENAPANSRPPTLGISERNIRTILSKLKDHITPSINDGPPRTTVLEKYWDKKIFQPKNTKTDFSGDISATNIKLNDNSLNLIKDTLNDDRKLKKLIEQLKTGDIFAPGLQTGFVDSYENIFKGAVDSINLGSSNIEDSYETYSDLTSIYSEILSNEVGVNIDNEINQLTILQSSYAASARSISTINEMFEALIKSVEV